MCVCVYACAVLCGHVRVCVLLRHEYCKNRNNVVEHKDQCVNRQSTVSPSMQEFTEHI